MPDDPTKRSGRSSPRSNSKANSGLQTPQKKKKTIQIYEQIDLGLKLSPKGKGMKVLELSKAAKKKAGLREGDLIVKIDGEKIREIMEDEAINDADDVVQDLEDLLREHEQDADWPLEIVVERPFEVHDSDVEEDFDLNDLPDYEAEAEARAMEAPVTPRKKKHVITFTDESGEYVPLGLQFKIRMSQRTGKISIELDTLKGGLAHKKGILAGDSLFEANGINIESETYEFSAKIEELVFRRDRKPRDKDDYNKYTKKIESAKKLLEAEIGRIVRSLWPPKDDQEELVVTVMRGGPAASPKRSKQGPLPPPLSESDGKERQESPSPKKSSSKGRDVKDKIVPQVPELPKKTFKVLVKPCMRKKRSCLFGCGSRPDPGRVHLQITEVTHHSDDEDERHFDHEKALEEFGDLHVALKEENIDELPKKPKEALDTNNGTYEARQEALQAYLDKLCRNEEAMKSEPLLDFLVPEEEEEDDEEYDDDDEEEDDEEEDDDDDDEEEEEKPLKGKGKKGGHR